MYSLLYISLRLRVVYTVHVYKCTLCAHQGRQQWLGLTAHHCQAKGESAARGADTYKQTHHDPDPVVTMTPVTSTDG